MTSTFTTLRRAAVALAITALLLLPASAVASGQDLRSPDTRDAANGYTGTYSQDLRSPDTRDAANGYTGTHSQDLSAPGARETTSASPSGGGVDWASAGIGAAVFGGFVLLGAGGWAAAVTIRRRRTTA